MFISLQPIIKELTILKEFSNLGARCLIECTRLKQCYAFVRNNKRCVLIGESTLPGENVNGVGIQDLMSTNITYRKLER